jgi:hypothetical protein
MKRVKKLVPKTIGKNLEYRMCSLYDFFEYDVLAPVQLVLLAALLVIILSKLDVFISGAIEMEFVTNNKIASCWILDRLFGLNSFDASSVVQQRYFVFAINTYT